MRSLMSAALLGLAIGCAPAPSPVHLVTREAGTALEDLLRARPLAPGANLRIDEVARTTTSSMHLVQVNGGETPHRHAAHDLTVAVLRGEGTLTLDGVRHPMSAGDVVVIPRGVTHYFVRSGRSLAVSLAIFAPPLDGPDVVPEPATVDSPPAAR